MPPERRKKRGTEQISSGISSQINCNSVRQGTLCSNLTVLKMADNNVRGSRKSFTAQNPQYSERAKKICEKGPNSHDQVHSSSASPTFRRKIRGNTPKSSSTTLQVTYYKQVKRCLELSDQMLASSSKRLRSSSQPRPSEPIPINNINTDLETKDDDESISTSSSSELQNQNESNISCSKNSGSTVHLRAAATETKHVISHKSGQSQSYLKSCVNTKSATGLVTRLRRTIRDTQDKKKAPDPEALLPQENPKNMLNRTGRNKLGMQPVDASESSVTDSRVGQQFASKTKKLKDIHNSRQSEMSSKRKLNGTKCSLIRQELNKDGNRGLMASEHKSTVKRLVKKYSKPLLATERKKTTRNIRSSSQNIDCTIENSYKTETDLQETVALGNGHASGANQSIKQEEIEGNHAVPVSIEDSESSVLTTKNEAVTLTAISTRASEVIGNSVKITRSKHSLRNKSLKAIAAALDDRKIAGKKSCDHVKVIVKLDPDNAGAVVMDNSAKLRRSRSSLCSSYVKASVEETFRKKIAEKINEHIQMTVKDGPVRAALAHSYARSMLRSTDVTSSSKQFSATESPRYDDDSIKSLTSGVSTRQVATQANTDTDNVKVMKDDYAKLFPGANIGGSPKGSCIAGPTKRSDIVSSAKRSDIVGSSHKISTSELAGKAEAASLARKLEPTDMARKAEAAGLARKAEAAGLARKAEAAGLARKAEAAGSARKAEAAGSARKAEAAGSARKAEAAGSARKAEAAGSARKAEAAGSARKAEAAGSARKAEAAGSARKAEAAGSARKAEAAGSARKAEAAGSARKAEAAGSASKAEAAGSASKAEAAGSARKAESAGSATETGAVGSATRAFTAKSPTRATRSAVRSVAVSSARRTVINLAMRIGAVSADTRVGAARPSTRIYAGRSVKRVNSVKSTIKSSTRLNNVKSNVKLNTMKSVTRLNVAKSKAGLNTANISARINNEESNARFNMEKLETRSDTAVLYERDVGKLPFKCKLVKSNTEIDKAEPTVSEVDFVKFESKPDSLKFVHRETNEKSTSKTISISEDPIIADKRKSPEDSEERSYRKRSDTVKSPQSKHSIAKSIRVPDLSKCLVPVDDLKSCTIRTRATLKSSLMGADNKISTVLSDKTKFSTSEFTTSEDDSKDTLKLSLDIGQHHKQGTGSLVEMETNNTSVSKSEAKYLNDKLNTAGIRLTRSRANTGESTLESAASDFTTKCGTTECSTSKYDSVKVQRETSNTNSSETAGGTHVNKSENVIDAKTRFNTASTLTSNKSEKSSKTRYSLAKSLTKNTSKFIRKIYKIRSATSDNRNLRSGMRTNTAKFKSKNASKVRVKADITNLVLKSESFKGTATDADDKKFSAGSSSAESETLGDMAKIPSSDAHSSEAIKTSSNTKISTKTGADSITTVKKEITTKSNSKVQSAVESGKVITENVGRVTRAKSFTALCDISLPILAGSKTGKCSTKPVTSKSTTLETNEKKFVASIPATAIITTQADTALCPVIDDDCAVFSLTENDAAKSVSGICNVTQSISKHDTEKCNNKSNLEQSDISGACIEKPFVLKANSVKLKADEANTPKSTRVETDSKNSVSVSLNTPERKKQARSRISETESIELGQTKICRTTNILKKLSEDGEIKITRSKAAAVLVTSLRTRTQISKYTSSRGNNAGFLTSLAEPTKSPRREHISAPSLGKKIGRAKGFKNRIDQPTAVFNPAITVRMKVAPPDAGVASPDAGVNDPPNAGKNETNLIITGEKGIDHATDGIMDVNLANASEMDTKLVTAGKMSMTVAGARVATQADTGKLKDNQTLTVKAAGFTIAFTQKTRIATACIEETAIATASTEEAPVAMAITEETAVATASAEETAVSTASAEVTAVATASAEEMAVATASAEVKAVATASAEEMAVATASAEEKAVAMISAEEMAVATASAEEMAVATASAEEMAVASCHG
nr:uncharacterized protein LOC123763148 [Procambarus clarkii]XP_045606066.1 uncharacterized protein LOC123763148 [Procambarus clarkii]XP_045606067.1 uncharacterized protein LOC123763148 [Procambarus clarkii]